MCYECSREQYFPNSPSKRALFIFVLRLIRGSPVLHVLEMTVSLESKAGRGTWSCPATQIQRIRGGKICFRHISRKVHPQDTQCTDKGNCAQNPYSYCQPSMESCSLTLILVISLPLFPTLLFLMLAPKLFSFLTLFSTYELLEVSILVSCNLYPGS